MKIKKGDLVEIIAGKDRGEQGRVLDIFSDENKVVVEGLNIQKRHIKAGARQSMPQGGILDRPGKIHVSNVRLYSEKLGSGVRVGYKVLDGGDKIRVARGQKHGEAALD